MTQQSHCDGFYSTSNNSNVSRRKKTVVKRNEVRTVKSKNISKVTLSYIDHLKQTIENDTMVSFIYNFDRIKICSLYIFIFNEQTDMICFLIWLLLLHDYLCIVYNSRYIEINIMKTNKTFF